MCPFVQLHLCLLQQQQQQHLGLHLQMQVHLPSCVVADAADAVVVVVVVWFLLIFMRRFFKKNIFCLFIKRFANLSGSCTDVDEVDFFFAFFELFVRFHIIFF